jgi:hypothetical protein
MTPRLFLDLDGVLADFDGGFERIFGVHPSQVEDDWLHERLAGKPDFFSEIPMIPGAHAFFFAVMPLNPMILTAVPRHNQHEAAAAKMRWVREHIDPNVPVLCVRGGRHKRMFVQQPGDVLVDDHAPNCNNWLGAGGDPILFTDYFSTLSSLEMRFGLRSRWREAKQLDAFLEEVRAEAMRARRLHPGNAGTGYALAEEYGELAKAILDEPAANVRMEAVQTAAMAARMAIDGDSLVTPWRERKGLDAIGVAA